MRKLSACLGVALWFSIGEAFVPVRLSSPTSARYSSEFFSRDMFNGYHEPAVKPDNVEAEEQRKRADEAEQQVARLQTQLKHKETEYQKLISSLREEIRQQKTTAKDRVNKIAETMQNFKFDAHRKQLEMQEASKRREEKLRKELEILGKEKTALLAELKEVKEKYVEDSIAWEDRLESEQDARASQESRAQQEMIRLQEEARKKLAAAKVEATVKLSRKERELLEKDYTVKETRWDVGNKEMRIQELEEERQSLRKLASISWGLTKSRVGDKLQDLKKRLVARNGKKENGLQEPDEDISFWDQSLQ